MTERRLDWQVPMSHPAFAGHFPGHPILPGVVLLDRVMFLAQSQLEARDALAGAWTVAQTKFLSPVTPGDVLTFVLTDDARGGWRFAVAAADGRPVASGSLTAPKA
jgi:3-hydroxyacyl-[acyl-carrier-protein] dehydratase